MTNEKFKKVGTLKVSNGSYIKDGIEKKRWHDVGTVFASPHHSRMAIKFHATAFSDEKWASIFYDEDSKPNFGGKSMDIVVL